MDSLEHSGEDGGGASACTPTCLTKKATAATTPTTTTTTSTSTGRQSTGLQHSTGPCSTPDRRRFAVSTDDAAIFIEDTIDRTTAQCIATSPSALAILSPQRMPSTAAATHVDVTDYDPEHIGGGNTAASSSSAVKGRRSILLSGGTDSSGLAACNGERLSFGKSPTPRPSRKSGSMADAQHSTPPSHSTPPRREVTTSSSACSSAVRRRLRATPSPATAARSSEGDGPHSEEGAPEPPEPMVPLYELERVERERNRFEKMYEHQKALYEDMAEQHAKTHASLQDKIIEVVALSTRNEESKKFIRQLKREMAESRTRVMDIQNRALEEARAERNAKSRYENLIEEYEHKYKRTVERHETKMAGLESLLKDLTCMRDEHDRVHVSQLDALLKAAYAKSTALFSDLLRQSRQVDLLYDSKEDLERQVDQLRKEKREMEATLAEERRRMIYESERFIEQIEEQQQSILSLRQMLIRALDVSGAIDNDDDNGGADLFDDRRGSYSYHKEGSPANDRDAGGDEEDDWAAHHFHAHYGGHHREIVVEAEGHDGAAEEEENATPLRKLRTSVVKTRGGGQRDRERGTDGSDESGSRECESSSRSEKRTLVYLRSRLAEPKPTAPADEGGSSHRDGDGGVKAAAKGRAVAAAVGSLSSNSVLPASQQDGEDRASAGYRDDEDSIFKPPKLRTGSANSRGGSSDRAKGKERKEEGEGSASRKKMTASGGSSSVATVTVSSKPPLLRERDLSKSTSGGKPPAARPSSSSSSSTAVAAAPTADEQGGMTSATTASTTSSSGGSVVAARRVTDLRHVEPYRIPRAAEGTGKDDLEPAPALPGKSIDTAGAGASSSSSSVAARKRLDFAAALASVSAKREQERKAREASSLAADKENRVSGSSSSSTGKPPVATKPPLKAHTSSSRAAEERDDDDDDDVPRLMPKQTQPRPSLRTTSQRGERAADK